MPAWPLDRPPSGYEIGHVRAVLPDRVLDDARVVVRDGVVVEVGPHPPATSVDVDGRGHHLLPGLVDVHSDALGREVRPRPGVSLEPAFALGSATGRLRAGGVTTTFHGLGFQSRSAVGLSIGSPDADDLYDVLTSAGAHRVLHRLDVRSRTGRTMLEKRLADWPDDAPLPVVSHEDHTPGQGQYADPATMRRWLETGEGMDAEQAAAHVEWWRRSRDEHLDRRDDALAWLGGLARSGRIVLFGHDPQTVDDVDGLVARGGRVAEFPTTLVAARAARAQGLLVVAGAPNVVRGGSHAGNVSATQLVADGLVDALASDYLPTALLPAAVLLARRGLVTLPEAVGLVTSGPTACAGLGDRGRLEPGARADLVLADLDPTWPCVLHVLEAPDTSPC